MPPAWLNQPSAHWMTNPPSYQKLSMQGKKLQKLLGGLEMRLRQSKSYAHGLPFRPGPLETTKLTVRFERASVPFCGD
jgi:hypothetical protein